MPASCYPRLTLPKLGLALLFFMGACAAHAEDKPARDFSAGLSLGPLSGVAGPSVRYWQERFGIQASLFPFIDYQPRSGEVDGFCLLGAQLLYREDYALPKGHEQGGYRYSFPYGYGGLSLLLAKENSYASLGSGLGVETRWRRFRLASGIGLMAFWRHREENSDRLYVLPSLDFSLQVGL